MKHCRFCGDPMEDDQEVCFSCGRVQRTKDEDKPKGSLLSLLNKKRNNLDYEVNDTVDDYVDDSVSYSSYNDRSTEDILKSLREDSKESSLASDSNDFNTYDSNEELEDYIDSDELDEEYDGEELEDYDDSELEDYDDSEELDGLSLDTLTRDINEEGELSDDFIPDGDALGEISKPKEIKKEVSKTSITALIIGLIIPIVGLILATSGINNAKKGKEGYLIPILALIVSIIGFIIQFLF